MTFSENSEVIQVLRRLQENVRRGLPDQAPSGMKIPARTYSDEAQYQREIERIFLKVPLCVALTCDIPEPGDFQAFDMAGRPILVVRGDDGKARTFLNICRHRGARVTELECGRAKRFQCMYHYWTYDRQGVLDGITGAETFGDVDAKGLVELPTDEHVGMIFASLDPDATVNAREWLGGMDRSLADLEFDKLYPYKKITKMDSPNWKLAADGYLDGYHLGYLHRNTIGTKSIGNRNTYDLFGNHVRIGFANKLCLEYDNIPEAELEMGQVMSLVHYIFPNVSISGGHGGTVQLSRLFPGKTSDISTTTQQQYFTVPIEGEMVQVAETKRLTYEQVVRDEDCFTIFGIERSLPALKDSHLMFGRNEMGNIHLHRCVEQLTRA